MQKKIYLLASLLVLLVCPVKSQQFMMQGTYNDILLDSFSYTSIVMCSPFEDFSMILDSNLIPYADGMTIVAVVTEVNVPQPNTLLSSYGPVNVGDTIPFDTTHIYPFYFNAGGTVKWEFRAMGVPTTLGQVIPCDYEILATLGVCTNGVILGGIFGTPDCTVQLGAAVEDGSSLGWELYPSPSHGPMRLQHKDGITQWETADLSDIRGRIIRHWETGDEINTAGLESGVYFLKATSLSIPFVFRIMVE